MPPSVRVKLSKPPSLTLFWCVVPALSIAVVMALDYPFAGEIGVNLQPLLVVAERLHAHF